MHIYKKSTKCCNFLKLWRAHFLLLTTFLGALESLHVGHVSHVQQAGCDPMHSRMVMKIGNLLKIFWNCALICFSLFKLSYILLIMNVVDDDVICQCQRLKVRHSWWPNRTLPVLSLPATTAAALCLSSSSSFFIFKAETFCACQAVLELTES